MNREKLQPVKANGPGQAESDCLVKQSLSEIVEKRLDRFIRSTANIVIPVSIRRMPQL